LIPGNRHKVEVNRIHFEFNFFYFIAKECFWCSFPAKFNFISNCNVIVRNAGKNVLQFYWIMKECDFLVCCCFSFFLLQS
jgi:hypothetical protein